MDRLLKYFEQRFNARMEKWTYHMCSMNFHEVMDILVKSFFERFWILKLSWREMLSKASYSKWALEGNRDKGMKTQLYQAVIQDSSGCPAVSQRCKGFWETMANQTCLWRPETKAASFEMLSKQGDALLLPLRNCACQYPLGTRIARVDNISNTQRCQGDRDMSQQSHKRGPQRTGMSCNNDLAILSPLKSGHLLLLNLVMLLYSWLFCLCFFFQWFSLYFWLPATSSALLLPFSSPPPPITLHQTLFWATD